MLHKAKTCYNVGQPTNSYIIFLSCWAAHKFFYNIGQQNFSLWQALFNKAPNKGGKRKSKEIEAKSQPKAQKPKVGFKGQRNKLCSKAPPTNHKKHIQERK